MKSRVLALTLLTVFLSVFCAPAFAVALDKPIDSLLDAPVVIQVNATGKLESNTNLEVDFGNGLSFNPTGGSLVATADQVVTVTFSDNTDGYQSIIVSTENPTVPGTDENGNAIDIVRSGLISTTNPNSASSIPLHWTVFNTFDEANGYYFEQNVFPDGFDQAGEDVSGKIDNRYNFYVVDRNQVDFESVADDGSQPVIGFATVIAGIENGSGTLANAPYDKSPTVDDDMDGDQDSDDEDKTPSVNDGLPRETDKGQVFMKFGADYNGASAGTYGTSTLTLDLITM